VGLLGSHRHVSDLNDVLIAYRNIGICHEFTAISIEGRYGKERGKNMRVSTVIIIVLLVAASVIFVFHLEWQGFFNVKCDPEDQVHLTGMLQGFATNSTHRDYTDVRIDGVNYTFYMFDKEMALHFAGSKVEINACYCQNTSRSIKNYYDLLSIFLIGE